MKALVTGAAGFVGSHVVKALHAAGHEVTGLDLREQAPDAAVREVTGDLRGPLFIERALGGVDVVATRRPR
ncbi:NAD-dependent epimerase/dehydratase family protein [Sphaerisporangium sp. NBC_01403]|uniref:NAD-dependent epimerase/dehydratase family protein n=1 Tax=Sphaerisporangium sp. NBC_01403 TaxID=2903599 RepID=UPI00324D2EA9